MKILVVQTGFLGDVVLSTPVFTQLRKLYPSAKISVMTTPLASGLLAEHPAIDERLSFDKRGAQSGVLGLLALAKELRESKFDVVFSLHKSWRTALLLYLAKIPERIGFREAAGRFLYSQTVPRKDLAHEVQRNLAILRAVQVDPGEVDEPMSLSVSKLAESQSNTLLTDGERPWVGLAPGSVWATKRWTPEGFAAVADALHDAGYAIALIGGPTDAEAGAAVEGQSKASLLNLIGKTSLEESVGVISRFELLVSNDSAPLHIAAARGVPVLALFCATVPEFGFTPWKVKHRSLGVDGLACRPCGRHGGNTCPTGTHACQLQLTAGPVIDAALELLNACPKKENSGHA